MPEWIDISLPLERGMPHWPPSPPFMARRVLDIEHLDPCNVSVIWIGSHCGTHIDAPRHTSSTGDGVCRMPIDVSLGPARVIHVPDVDRLSSEDLAAHGVREGERLLLRTRRSDDRAAGRTPRPVCMTPGAARFLIERRIRLLGVDLLHIDDPDDLELTAVRDLLANGVWVIGGLELSRVSPGTYELVCLPLLVPNADGAPARAVVRAL